MDLLKNLGIGFSEVFGLANASLPLIGSVPLPLNILFCFIGCFVGTLVGVLPGIGPVATIAILLPLTFGLDPTAALIMLAGIYYGAQYGGSTTAILVNIPGEGASIVTAIDGHQMARDGRAGKALGVAALGSFFAGCVSTLIIAAVGAPLSRFGLVFGPTEYFSLMIMGLVFAITLAGGSVIKAVAMIMLGILISSVGTDLETGAQRMTLGSPYLYEGVDFAVLAMGLFGIAEILRNVEIPDVRDVASTTLGRLLPDRDDMKRSAYPIARGTAIGSILGLLPGNGAVLGPFASYTVEKRLANDPERFGHGAIEGVAGPEAANNAGAQTSFIPLLTLGIPPNAVMALMVGAMTIHGIIPGPQVMTSNPDLFWGLVVSMWLGNAMLLVINLPLIGLWVKLLKVPYRLLYPAILVFCCIGIYSVNTSTADLVILAVFSIAGYVFGKLGFEVAPLLLGVVLGRMMEENLRRALILSDGDFSVFVRSPISAGFLVLSALLLVLIVLPRVRNRREKVFVGDD